MESSGFPTISQHLRVQIYVLYFIYFIFYFHHIFLLFKKSQHPFSQISVTFISPASTTSGCHGNAMKIFRIIRHSWIILARFLKLKLKWVTWKWPLYLCISWDFTTEVLRSVPRTNDGVLLEMYVCIVHVGILVELMHSLYFRDFLPFSHTTPHKA